MLAFFAGMKNPSMEHFASAKRELRHVKGTLNFSLKYQRGKKLSLEGYYDSDYGRDLDDSKSTSCVFFF